MNLAAEALFVRYFERLKALARSRLSSRLARRTDAEDVVMSVYRSFFAGARAGRFTLTRGGDLWRLLSAITKRSFSGSSVMTWPADARSTAKCRWNRSTRAEFAERGHAVAGGGLRLLGRARMDLRSARYERRRVLELRLQGAQLTEIARETEPLGTYRPAHSRSHPRSHRQAKKRSRPAAPA